MNFKSLLQLTIAAGLAVMPAVAAPPSHTGRPGSPAAPVKHNTYDGVTSNYMFPQLHASNRVFRNAMSQRTPATGEERTRSAFVPARVNFR